MRLQIFAFVPRVDRMAGISADRPGICITTVLECQGSWCMIQSRDGSMSLMHEDGVGKYACGPDVL